MKKFKSLIIWLTLLAICAIVLFKCNNPLKRWLTERKIDHAASQAQKQDIQYIDRINYIYRHDTVKKYIKQGIQHSTKEIATGTYQQLALFYKGRMDSALNELGIKSKQLNDLIDMQVGVSGNIHAKVINNYGVLEIPFADSFLHGIVLSDSPYTDAQVMYSGAFKLQGIMYWKHKHHFWFIRWGMPIFESDWHSNCSNVSIDSIDELKIIKRNKKE